MGWQAHAEGDSELERKYFERVAETAEALFAGHPNDPNQIWVVYDYLFACGVMGIEFVENAVARMKEIIATHEPCVLTWAARYQVGLFSTLYPSIPVEGREQYAAMLAESDLPFYQTALGSAQTARDSAGMLELMKGHALFGVGRYSDAEEQYARVVETYADRVAWAPRSTGRVLVDTSRYGVLSSAAYSLALCRSMLNREDVPIAEKGILDFLAAYPSSEYTDNGVHELAKLCEKNGEYAEAIAYHQRLIAEYPDNERGKNGHCSFCRGNADSFDSASRLRYGGGARRRRLSLCKPRRREP